MENTKEIFYPQVLLLGNGINQLNGGVSWNGFLREIATKKEIKEGHISIEELKCPEPLKAILVTEDHVDQAMKTYCGKIALQEQSPAVCAIYRSLLTMGFDDILTTNYTYELEIVASDPERISEAKIKKMMCHTAAVKRAESKYCLHTYNQLLVDSHVNRVWHIHGEARKPDSTILGHYYYGNLLHQIKESLKKYKYAENLEVTSWVDTFIQGDIYVVGFGFGLSELDLWWLLNRKAREKVTIGKVYFYCPEPIGFDEKIELLRMMKRVSDGENLVEIISCGYKNKIVLVDGKEKVVLDGNYEEFYHAVLSDISEKIHKKKERTAVGYMAE